MPRAQVSQKAALFSPLKPPPQPLQMNQPLSLLNTRKPLKEWKSHENPGAMLESALENILLQYLAPYVDGITRDQL